MRRKFDVRRYLTAFFIGIFAVAGSIVAIGAPANAVAGDSSTVDYTGTFNYTTGPSGASVSPIASSDTTFTVEAWVNPATWASTHDYMVIFGQGLSTAGCVANRYGLMLSNTANDGWKIHFAHNDCGVFSPVLVPNNSWTHIAEVVNGNSVSIYINGTAAWTTTYNWSASFGTGSVIGSAVNGDDSFKGSIDQVKIWDSNLTQSQVQTSMHTFGAGGISGLNAHFDFNEDSGNTVYNRANTSQYLTATAVTRADVKTTSLQSGRTVVRFPRTYLPGVGGWRVPAGVTRLDALAVAGGGAGGSRHGGGGGAGELGSYSGFAATPGSDLTVKVGMGGAGFDSTSNNTSSSGGSGQSTVFGNDEFLGGGGGQAGTGPVKNGGSGGGTAGTTSAGIAVNGSGTTSSPTLVRYASAGGSGNNNGSNWWGGGGGGGATGAGVAATSSTVAGNGGQGYSSSITGTAYCYAAGGGGASSSSSVGAAGTCVNGAATTATAGSYDDVMGAATPNSGSGGGAGGLAGDDKPSDAGASGVVILSYAASLADNAWDFDGAGDNKYVATSKQVIPSKASYTIEGWIKADTLRAAGWNDIFRQQSTSSNYNAFSIGVYNKRLQVIHSIQSSDAGTYNTYYANSDPRTLFTTSQWYHIAVSTSYTVSGTDSTYLLKVFIDGVEVFSGSKTYATSALSVLGNAEVSFGGLYSSTTRGWDGQLDQFKVWNGALTQSEIQKSMHTYDASGVVSTSGASLRALYDFNSATTTTLVDQTGNGYDFAPTAGAASPTVRNVRDLTTSGATTSYTFTRTYLNTWGGWIPETTSSAMSVLAIGGGGGGAENVGAGGSGGGISYATGKSVSPSSALPIQVGLGGYGGSYYLNNSSDSSTATQLRDGSNGQDSRVVFSTAMVGTGGIGGQTYWLDNKCGGAGNNNVDTLGVAGTGGSTNSAGGTGGKGAAGSGNGFAGGAGYTTSIRGTSETFAGGGGGGSFGAAGETGGAGGTGGGGAGASASGAAGTAASANTGGGGGGGSVQCGAGANGGSGIVILASVATAGNPTISSHPASVTKTAGQTATFSVSATSPDSGTLSYQWEVSANNGTNWLNVSGGTGATTSSYTTPSLVSADLGKQYRVVVTNTLSGATATTTSSAATLTIGLDKVNVAFDELNFDYSNIAAIVGTTGKNQGDKILFLNVTTKDGVQVDALVTTETLSSAAITNYESGARAGGANSYFQTDVDFTASNGFAQFKFDFYKHGVAGSAGNPCSIANNSCSGATKVVIQNVNVSAIDIDYYQWNDFTAAESYTLAGNTKLKECAIPNTGTCTVRSAPSSYPADIRFQGSPDTTRTNDPVDMAIVTYADIETFRIKFGRDRAGSPNYFGVAFKALDWGTAVPQTTGGSATYTISYDANGATTGSQTGTHVGAAGSSYTVLTAGTAVKTGYTFAGWSTSSTATTATYAASSKVTMPGSNLTLYAVWTPIKYTLTYNANGGTGAPASGSFETGTNNVTLSSTVPTRTGYVFGGWDTVVNSGSGNTNYASGASYSMPASNTTLYAKWTVANGTLAYNGNNGTTTEVSVTAAGGTTTTVATGGNTTRSGYDFVGWNSKADGTGTSYAVGSTFTLQATVTTTIYAQWTLSKYTLVFNVNGGVGTPQSQSYVQGATTTMPVTNPTRAGYTFGGWNSAANGTGTNYSGSFLMPGNNLTLYAKWTPITYSVLYNNNAATYSGATGTVTDATAYTAAQVATVSAATGLSNTTGGTTYRFIGWNTNAAGTGTDYMPGDSITMPAANVTLYAMWLDASIEIAYNANGGTGAPANTNATSGQVFTISSTQPTRSGYTFAGWNLQDNSPAGGPFNASGTFTPNSNEILVAQWTAINYTVTYNTDGGSTAPSQLTNKHIDDVITVDSSAPTKTGYTFLGWLDGNGNIYPAGGTFTMPSGNVTLTAQWQGNAYSLTYDANGGSAAPVAETRNYNATANLSATAPTRTGYTFQGWNTLVGGGGTAYNASASFTMPNANTTLFAQWTANTYVFAYNTQGGSTAPSSSNKSYGASVTVAASTPTRSGYSFAGWNTAANGTGTTYLQSTGFTMPDADVTLYAQWTKTAFTLYYNTNGGQGVYSSQPIKYTESVTVDSTIPTKTGFTFSGWNTAADGSGFDYTPMGIFTLNVAANVTLYAKWTAVSYSLTYNANTGSGAPAGGSHVFGATVTTASGNAPLALTGFRFIGWNDRADGSGTTYVAGGTFAMPASNVILYAQWIDATVQIAYNANGGSGGPDGATAIDGSTYTIDSIQPVRPGYTFSGWKLQDGTPTNATLTTGGTNSFTVSGNELLVAQWTIKSITVTYDLNAGGGTTPNAQTANYNTGITLASSSGISRANFQFVGWSTTPDGSGPTYADGSNFSMPTSDVILYAKWAPVYFIIEYNPAGGTGEPADQFATPTSTVALATQEPTKPGYEFEKWTEVVQGTDFTPGASLTMPSSNVLLVANYTLKAASVPGSGSGTNTGIDPITNPAPKPKQLVLSVYFKGDSPVLIPRTKLALQKLAKLAKSYGRANNITIYGRVKETNDKSYDMRLSKARATNVAAYLKKFGVTGVFQVYAKGISPENTWKSRRVDIKLWWAK